MNNCVKIRCMKIEGYFLIDFHKNFYSFKIDQKRLTREYKILFNYLMIGSIA